MGWTRTIALGLVGLGAAAPTAAQMEPWRLGVIAGPNRMTLVGGGDIEARFGGTFGAFAARPLGDHLALRGEVLYVRRTVREAVFPCAFFGCPEPLAGTADLRDTHLTTADLPLLLEWTPADAAGAVQAFVQGGPFAGVRVGCSLTTNLADGGSSSGPCQGDMQRFDVGFVLSGGVRYRGLGIGLRWTRGWRALEAPVVDGGSALTAARASSLAVLIELATDLDR